MAAVPDQFNDKIADEHDAPSDYFLNWFFQQADVTGPGSKLHLVGARTGTVSSGDHTHDGANSQYLFNPTPTLSPLPATASNADIINAINAVIAHLVSRGAGVTRES